MKLTRHKGKMTYSGAYLHAMGWVVFFVGSVWAWKAASNLYDRLFGGK